MCRSMGAGKANSTQTATNAKFIENMNEAQINNEIEKTKRDIEKAEKVMNKNSITNTAEANAMREAFPLGYGASTEKQIAKMGEINERDAHKAKTYTEAWSEKETAKTRLAKLEEAKKKVKGTGKTEKQIQDEATKKAVETATKTLNWKTTQKESWSNGGFKPKVIKAGNMEIHGSNGFYSVYKDGKLITRTDKLSKAKAYAEKAK